MKVWHKAGDYWRRGLRLGDTLPYIVPMTTITRLEDGWIALFPKDKHLLATGQDTALDVVITESWNDERTTQQEPDSEATPTTEPVPAVETSTTANHQPRREEPRQLDLFAQLQQENEVLQARIAELERRERERQGQECTERFRREEEPRRAQPRRPATVRRQQPPSATAAVSDASASDNSHTWLKTAGYLAAASVALLVIWQTGLIIPLGLIGLATSGILK
jgi:hypothetical protein